jgi:hypothetical protein
MAESIERGAYSPNKASDWKSTYESALRETDIPALFRLVEETEPAMRGRLEVLASSSEEQAERQALEDALDQLRLLKRTRLSFHCREDGCS